MRLSRRFVQPMNATIRETVETIALAVIVFLVLQATIQNYRVEGPSMQPQFAGGELVLVNKAAYLHVDLAHLARYLPWVDGEEGGEWFFFRPPRQGEIVVFRNPRDSTEPDFVKRIIAGPGDTVEISQGQVFVNGEPLDEPYVERSSSTERLGPRVIANDNYFVLGDNRLHSDDSRRFGLVPLEHIIGKVWLSYWPLRHLGLFLTPWAR